MDFTNKILGKGLTFNYPYKTGNYPGHSENLQRIYDSIYCILSTHLGERPCLPDFGSNIYRYVFSMNNSVFRDTLHDEIMYALGKWEQRITVTGIFIDPKVTSNEVPVVINFIVKATSQQGAYVFPYMLRPYNIGG